MIRITVRSRSSEGHSKGQPAKGIVVTEETKTLEELKSRISDVLHRPIETLYTKGSDGWVEIVDLLYIRYNQPSTNCRFVLHIFVFSSLRFLWY